MPMPIQKSQDRKAGRDELASARAEQRLALRLAFGFSFIAGLLALTAPLYMLQVYDRVLASRSVETLLVLSGLMAFLFLILGLVDHARARIMARVGARLQVRLETRVLSAAFRRLAATESDLPAQAAQHDLDALVRFWCSPVLLALMDLPWTLVFLGLVFAFHPLLGWMAFAGGGCLLLMAAASHALSQRRLQESQLASLAADREAAALTSEAELVQALGMAGAAIARWAGYRRKARASGLGAADTTGAFAVASRTFRLFLQSALLGVAAWLVLRQELSAGAMIAVSVLMGRALQPVEQIVGQWAVVERARQAQGRLAALLSAEPVPAPRTPLPRPRAVLEVQGLSVAPPERGAAVLRGVSFTLQPGQSLGVIGPSGSGKSTLARALTGLWPPLAGAIRLDGALVEHYGAEALGRLVGYLPQRVTLFDGSVAENIARLDPEADSADVIAAAQRAGAHAMILGLPQGYDTPVSASGSGLSGGQIQRIGLARAVYGDPVILILDEPNAHLDTDGSLALNRAIRAAKAAGAAVLIIAHRPAAIQECDLLMVLQDGGVTACGPRDTVLREAVRNAGDILRGAVA